MKGCEWKSFLQSFWWCKAVIDFQMSVCCLLHSLRMVCMQRVHLLVWHLQHSWRMVWMQWLYKNQSSQTLHCVGVMFKLPHYFFAHISNLHNFRCCGWLNVHSLCILATKENGGFPKNSHMPILFLLSGTFVKLTSRNLKILWNYKHFKSQYGQCKSYI